MALFLVESYAPGVSAEEIREGLRRLHEASAGATRFLTSTFVPEDEAFLCQLEAPSAGVVAEAYEQAGLRFARIVEAIQLEPTSLSGRSGRA